MIEMIEIPGKNYELGKYAVTQAQWLEIMGNNPSNFHGDLQRPVETVSWDDVQEFIQKLNAKTGEQYRLPTETEWNTANDNTVGTEDNSWCWRNSNSTTHPVGQKQANCCGLYDMYGNVWEWTSSGYTESRVMCGGSWYCYAMNLREKYHDRSAPAQRSKYVGFRLARTITKSDSNMEKEEE